MNILHMFGYSSSVYRYPILIDGTVPKTYLQLGFQSPAHTGPFKNALDFIIPDPRTNPIPIFAPASGRIVALVQKNIRWGNTSEYKQFLNYLTVQVTGNYLVPNSEFYELAHIGEGSCPFKIGQTIIEGNIITSTGLNGWITTTNNTPDYHLHFLVGVWKKGGNFTSLKIRFKWGFVAGPHFIFYLLVLE